MAATEEEPRKQRTARVEWAGLLRRTEGPGRVRLSAVWNVEGGTPLGVTVDELNAWMDEESHP
ncbi:hypothetical protein DAT35_56720 [Vitiosangium sp. GDMCC 1.1324]|nr:hypothetical protein DAT35_56720 [Vitiosangium sp. GDMCC 1.1324]